jgi:hypothetical protein
MDVGETRSACDRGERKRAKDQRESNVSPRWTSIRHAPPGLCEFIWSSEYLTSDSSLFEYHKLKQNCSCADVESPDGRYGLISRITGHQVPLCSSVTASP